MPLSVVKYHFTKANATFKILWYGTFNDMLTQSKDLLNTCKTVVGDQSTNASDNLNFRILGHGAFNDLRQSGCRAFNDLGRK